MHTILQNILVVVVGLICTLIACLICLLHDSRKHKTVQPREKLNQLLCICLAVIPFTLLMAYLTTFGVILTWGIIASVLLAFAFNPLDWMVYPNPPRGYYFNDRRRAVMFAIVGIFLVWIVRMMLFLV